MQVKSSDVDMYGVVTNTMYHEYMYAARAALGASVGLSMDVLTERYGIMIATNSFNITFKRCDIRRQLGLREL
jgi:acyl-CoA thioesterase FadM